MGTVRVRCAPFSLRARRARPGGLHGIAVQLVNFLVVAGIEALAHAEYDTRAPVHVHQQVAAGGVHAETFDFALLDGFVKGLSSTTGALVAEVTSTR